MAKLIATLGTSPGGIFETYTNLVKGTYEAENPIPQEIDSVYIIRTVDKEVDFAWKLIKLLFSCLKVPATISDIRVNVTDIMSKTDYDTFKNAIFDKIIKGDFVDFTGGRKSMSVAAAIGALKRGGNLVTTIIPQQEYNRIQQKLKELKEKKEKEIREIEEIMEKSGKVECGNLTQDLNEIIAKGAKTILLS